MIVVRTRTYASILALLGVMSTLAIYLPVRQSSKVEPMMALRANCTF